MESLQEYINEYRNQLQKGIIRVAYRGLMEYIMDLRTYFANQYPDYFVSGNIYYGYMDMTYFSFTPKPFRQRKLRVAIVFIHEPCRFEVWLAGINKQIQGKYWKLIKDSGWTKYPIISSTKGADSIINHVIASNPNFDDLNALTEQIENATLLFIHDLEDFLSTYTN